MDAPPRKKRCLASSHDAEAASQGGAVLEGGDHTIEEVLSDEELRPFTPHTVLVADTTPKRANALLQVLNKHLPMPPHAKHLKRIRRVNDAAAAEGYVLQVLVCDPSDEQKVSEPAIAGALAAFSLSLKPVEVSAFAPLTDAQYTEWNAIWPIGARPPPREIQPPSKWPTKAFTDGVGYMKVALEQANKAKNKGERPIGAVVVNPTTGQIVAKARDCSSSHPLDHAAMVCIHKVAAKDMADNPSTRGNYLCTGYHLYITREPCIMCAMAVLHSRFAKVFYGAPNLAMGGLGGRAKLHTHPSLNHHFQAYTGPLQAECRQLAADP